MQHHILRILFLAMAFSVICSEQAYGQFSDASGAKREVVLKRRIAPRSETFEDLVVLLPRGELDRISDQGAAGNWAQMLKLLKEMPAMQSAVKESYRYYGIGLASEALAYANANAILAGGLIDDAKIFYSLALHDMPEGPDYLYVAEAFKRAEKELKNYEAESYFRRLEPDRFSRAVTAKPGSGKELRSTPKVGRGVQRVMVNRDVVELTQAGLSEENLVWAISGQDRTQFDLSPDGLKYLIANKVTNTIIKAMRKRYSQQSASTPPPPKSL